MQPLIPTISIKATLAGFAELGLDTAVLLAPTGLTPDDLQDPFASVPNDCFAQIWMTAFQQMPDPTLPTKAGFAVPFSEFGLLDHLVETAVSPGEGLHILNLFLWLVSINMSLRFTHDFGDWIWVENNPPDPASFISEQWTLAIIVQRWRNHMDGFDIEELHLSQAANGEEKRFSELWGVPVRMGQKQTGAKLKAGIWNQPNKTANPLLQQTLRTVAEQAQIKQFEEAPLIYAIRTRLPEAIEQGEFSADDFAAELILSKRTLQRKLSAHNITFKELLDLYRQERAMLMLQNGEREMSQIAYALGYNEQSSFNRAFKRWTGKTPTGWIG